MLITEFSRPVASVFIALLIWQILAAFIGGWGTYGQMVRHGHTVGMAIIYHGSIWGGVFLWWVMATCWQRFAGQWSSFHVWGISLAVGVVVATLMVIVWKNGHQAEAHQQTSAGLPLALQLGAAIAISFVFFVFTKDVPSDFALLVAVLLFVYVFLSSHIVLSAFDPVFYNNKPALDLVTWATLSATFVALAVGYVGQQHNWWGWW